MHLSSTFRYLAIVLFDLLFIAGCKLQPVDAVYYGAWINTYSEEYSYDTQKTTILNEGDWIDKKWTAAPIILLDHKTYAQIIIDRNGKLTKQVKGKWSTRNNNDLTIQTDDYLFSGTIVLLNEELTVEGHQYPLDRYNRAIQIEGIKRKLKYRSATVEEKESYELAKKY